MEEERTPSAAIATLLRKQSSRLLLTFVLSWLPACAKVDPTRDYQTTRDRIADQTGVTDVFSPDKESLMEETAALLMTDGLTVDEAVRLGLLNNPQFQSAFYRIGASRADVVQSGLLSNPSLSLSLRFPEGGGRSNLTMGFGQELVDLWQIPVRNHVAETELDQVVWNAVREAVDLVADIRIRCYTLLALEETESILNEHLAVVRESLSLSQRRFDAGETSKLDVNLMRANLLQVQVEGINVQRDRRFAEAALARSLGVSRSGLKWRLTGPLPESAPEIPSNDDLLTLGLRQRVDTRIAIAQIEQAEGELRRQYLNIVPSVSAGVEFERLERRSLPGRKILHDTARASVAAGQLTAPDIQSRGERNLERRQIIDALLGPTIAITLPIWDQNQAQIAKAKYRVIELRTLFESTLDQIAQEVDQSATAYRTGAQLTSFYLKEGLPQVRENLDAVRSAYDAGEQNVVALLETQENLLVQRKAAVAARRDLAQASAELDRVVGGQWQGIATSQPTASDKSDSSN